MLGSVASTPDVAVQLATDRGLVSYMQIRNLGDVVLSFRKGVTQISYNLTELF